jgi:hypothetical protein
MWNFAAGACCTRLDLKSGLLKAGGRASGRIGASAAGCSETAGAGGSLRAAFLEGAVLAGSPRHKM